MPLTLHNTLTGKQEALVPGDPANILFYTCGPTVYDFAHIGNFRAFLFSDLLRRWLESPLCELTDSSGAIAPGPRAVTHVMNMTDVGHMTDDQAADGGGEDKMEAAAKRLLEDKKSGKLPEGVDLDPSNPYNIANFFVEAFLEDAQLLGLKVVEEAKDDPTLMPRPTEKVKGMIEMVLQLIDKGHAYIADGGVVYFDTQSFPDYGRLSGNTLDQLRAGAGGRVADANQQQKKHAADFLLWKPDPTHLMRWDPKQLTGDPDCPLEEGYPGWHLECSAMAPERLLGQDTDGEIDLHSGGEDNIFPHHECEIAQSSLRQRPGAFFARLLVPHPPSLIVEGEKMSKSKGNFFTVRQLLERGFEPAAIRLELIKTHYRVNANFTEQGLKDSARMIDRWRRFLDKAESSTEQGAQNNDVARAFADAMNDDLNIAGAMGVMNSWMNQAEKPTRADAALLRTFDSTLGVLALEAPALDTGDVDEAEIDRLLEARAQARADKNWAEADRIRDLFAEMGIEVVDTPEGATWKRKAQL